MAKVTVTCKYCKKPAEELSHITMGNNRFITLKCGHTYGEPLVSNPDSIKIVPIEKKETNLTEKYTMIASDLMRYHGISNRFTLHIDDRRSDILGATYVNVTQDGIIVGSIVLNRSHVETNDANNIIETILHEIAHAITPGAGHTEIWKKTCLAIGGNGQAFDWCEGSTKAITKICAICGQKAVEISHQVTEKERIINLACGHSYKEVLADKVEPTWKFDDGRQPYPFQYEGIEFARRAGFRVAILDECGLGKTLQGVGVLFRYPKEMGRTLIICKASLTYNWAREYSLCTGKIPQILDSSANRLDVLPVHIISFDTLSRAKGIEHWNYYQTVIIDECQQIKNHDAKRTNAVRKVTRNAKYVIALSADPIKNHAGEYFPILNILRPEIFPSQHHFDREILSSYSSYGGTVRGGLRDPKRFAQLTKDFIIRRTVEEVKVQMPSVRRDVKFFQLGDEVKKAYQRELNDFNDFYMNADEEQKSPENILAYLARMRHITGFAKVLPTVEYVTEYLESKNGDAKIVLFHHHEDVGELLNTSIEKYFPNRSLQMKSSDNAEERERKINLFKNEKAVFIIPTLAGGEGINLQFCNKAVLMEPEWNPASEEQAFPGRFRRIGSTFAEVEGMIPVAVGTIDEFLEKLKAQKKQIITEAYTGERGTNWNQSSVIKQLAELLYTNGQKGWEF